MQEPALGYREVIPDQTVTDPWKEISLNTGGTQGTLQDIKVAERANGFCYRDTIKHHTRNRFIYWRISHDVLELVENSLDVNLAGNRIRYKFVDTPILDGVSIHETYDNVVVLVPTVCSVHRLVFPHPDKYHRQDDVLGMHPDLAAPSIFSEATAADARDPTTFHFFTNTSTSSSQLPYLADSSLTLAEEEAIFVLTYPSGEILLVRQSREGKIDTVELKNESIVPRFLSGLADKLRHKDKDGDTTVSLLLHTFGLETYALTLCRNGQLKFWSCSRAECAAVIDIIGESGDTVRNQIQGAQNHILRKSVDGYDSECILAIFMSFSNESRFYILRPIISGSQVRLIKINILSLAQNDLIDFSLSNGRIWSVWRGKDGECEVYTSFVASNHKWSPVVLESVPDASQPPNIDGETDPRQVYLKHIFQPGKFPLYVISKALNIYKRSAIISDLNLSTAHLKQQICMAVEEEIQNELKESTVSDEDYLECANYCWQRFYSCCVQYHVAGLKPLGLLLFPNASGALLLKKTMISFLRPLDNFEQLTVDDYMFGEPYAKSFLLSENVDVTDDVIQLFKVCNYLDQQMSEVFAYAFEKELSMLNSPDIVMKRLLGKILEEMDKEFTDHVETMLQECSDLYQAMHKILEFLRVEYPVTSEPESDTIPSVNHIFTSQLGVSVVSGCLRQQSQVRFTICRNLLLICTILLERQESDCNDLETIRAVCIPEIVVLTQANYVMIWLSNLSALTYLPTETSLQRLSSLRLNPVYNIRTSSASTVSLLELFTGSTGGYEARKILARMELDEDMLACWNMSLLGYLNCLYHLIWPVSGNVLLAEWLLSCGQHVWLQQYVRYLSNWCEWNNCTHTFLLATSLLTTGENYKAQELFTAAAKGIFTDQFLAQRMLNFNSEETETRAYLNYYLRVIHLFELHKAYDCAISLANTALSVTAINDPLAATLYSIKFKHHLALKNYEDAYNALNSNPDAERRKDNLRDLVKKLLDEKKLDVLMEFTYGSMEELFCNIIFARARAADATNNIYYDFLYAYQIKRGPTFFRLAASVMYEQAFRLNQVRDPDALEKQVKCLLAAKNCLLLCEPEFAYIVMPVDQIEEKEIILPPSAKGDVPSSVIVLRNQVNLITLEELDKELKFATAKLKLFRFNPRSYFDITAPSELVVLLTTAGLYKTALNIAKIFDVSYRTVFESLTKRCGMLSKQDEPVAWKWLVENDLQDLPANTKSASSAAWTLLHECLFEYEEDKMSILHKVICKQIIKMHMWIPEWLLSSYKRRNPSELFRLFFNSGRLEEAVVIAIEYMNAALGCGKEYYGFAHAMQPTKPAICLPVRAFIMLLHQLRIINERGPDKPFAKEYGLLKGVLDTYLKAAQRMSNDMCRLKLSLARSN